MAPIVPDTITYRFDIKYEGLTGQHSTRVRIRPDFALQDAINTVTIVAQLMAPLLRDDVIINGFDMYLPGQTFSIPVGLNPIPGTAPGNQQPADFPAFISFIGRSNTGRRVRYFLYETGILPDADYRLPVSASPQLQALKNHLDNPATGIVAIDNSDIRVYDYVNLGYNAYYQRKRRQTA